MLPGPKGAMIWPSLICLCAMVSFLWLRGWRSRRRITLRDVQFGAAVDLAHAARHDDAVLFLDERRKLARPQHQILTINGGRKLLPLLGVLPPPGLHLLPDALKFLQRSRLV